jgi:hypothetical protein
MASAAEPALPPQPGLSPWVRCWVFCVVAGAVGLGGWWSVDAYVIDSPKDPPPMTATLVVRSETLRLPGDSKAIAAMMLSPEIVDRALTAVGVPADRKRVAAMGLKSRVTVDLRDQSQARVLQVSASTVGGLTRGETAATLDQLAQLYAATLRRDRLALAQRDYDLRRGEAEAARNGIMLTWNELSAMATAAQQQPQAELLDREQAETKLKALRAERDSLLSTRTFEHPEVRSVTEKIERLEQSLRRAMTINGETLPSPVANVPPDEVRRLMTEAINNAEKAGSVEREAYGKLLAAQTVDWEQLIPASTVTPRGTYSRPMLMGMVIALAAVSGLLASLLTPVRQSMLVEAEDVERSFGAPVLGTV